MTFREYVAARLGKWPEAGDTAEGMNEPYRSQLTSAEAWLGVMFNLLADYDEQREAEAEQQRESLAKLWRDTHG